MKKLIAAMLLALSIATEAQQADPKPPEPAKATVIFYRYRVHAGSVRRATVNVDGKRICSLVNGRYYKAEIPAGDHLITGPDARKGAQIALEAGKTYYFQAVLNLTGAFQVHNVFTVVPVSPEQGQFEIRALKEIDAADVAPKDK